MSFECDYIQLAGSVLPILRHVLITGNDTAIREPGFATVNAVSKSLEIKRFLDIPLSREQIPS